MACFFGHKWDGCKCSKCSKTRDEQHDWDLCQEKCKRCGKIQNGQHDWNGCVCKRCGKTRDEQHNWDGDKCKRCGKVRIAHKEEETVIETVIAKSVEVLVQLYSSSSRGEGFLKNSTTVVPVRKVGTLLNDTGGFPLMVAVHKQFAATYHIYGAARNLEMVWDGIGDWQG